MPPGWHYFSIVNEVKDFINTLREGSPPTVDPLDCAYAIKAIEAAYRSAGEGQHLVGV
jgi:UDP-N-acetyl-2-amino-2-deoxyglucuronate dehydrogenase